MFIPLAEVPSIIMGGGEERHYFYFHDRNADLPVEVVITRLPPYFGAERNWHKHDFVEEFSVPLMGEIVIAEKNDNKVEKRRHVSKSVLRDGEWVVGIECSNSREARIVIESSSGNRREETVAFEPQFTEGKNLHKVENPTNSMVTMLTMKRVPKKIFRKDPLIFKVDRNPALEER